MASKKWSYWFFSEDEKKEIDPVFIDKVRAEYYVFWRRILFMKTWYSSKILKNFINISWLFFGPKYVNTTQLHTTEGCAIPVQTYTDSIALPDHVNSTIKQSRWDHIDGCLDSKYRRLKKNVPPDSERLFVDGITKIVITITANKSC